MKNGPARKASFEWTPVFVLEASSPDKDFEVCPGQPTPEQPVHRGQLHWKPALGWQQPSLGQPKNPHSK
jgi:hypothetical protein